MTQRPARPRCVRFIPFAARHYGRNAERKQRQQGIDMRERLPDTRKSIDHKLVIRTTTQDGKSNRLHVYLVIGKFDDGRPGELFITINDASETLRGFAKVWAIAVSLCLQSGVPLSKLVEKFSRQNFMPNGLTENPEIPTCASIVDYVMRFMEQQFTEKCFPK